MAVSGFSVLVLAAASSASAQTWPLCFDEGAIPTPEAYAALREAANRFREAGRFGARATLSGSGLGEGKWSEATLTAYVELLRAGVAPSYLSVEATAPASECPSVTVEVLPAARNVPALWHFRGVYGFEPGSAETTSAGGRAVRIAAAMYSHGEARVILDGHTDTVGSPEANLELSRRRAEAVAHALVREGVRWDDIEIGAYGETRLVKPTPDEMPEALNRRVGIDVRYRSAMSD